MSASKTAARSSKRAADIPGPPDSKNGRDPYSRYLQKLGLLQSAADDLHGRYVKDEFAPRSARAALAWACQNRPQQVPCANDKRVSTIVEAVGG